jgi:hypothetical protein
MKKPEELLEEFKRNRERLSARERVEAYRAFNDAMAASLKESSRWQTKSLEP